MKGGRKVVVQPHNHDGVFVAKRKEDALCTKNMVVGESIYGENRISVQNEDGTKVEYRVWNPFHSNLAAAIIGGVYYWWCLLVVSTIYGWVLDLEYYILGLHPGPSCLMCLTLPDLQELFMQLSIHIEVAGTL